MLFYEILHDRKVYIYHFKYYYFNIFFKCSIATISSCSNLFVEYVNTWCVKNGKGKLNEKYFNDAITKKISYSRKQIKKSTEGVKNKDFLRNVCGSSYYVEFSSMY